MTDDRPKRFIDRCIDGEASADDITLFIHEWMDRDSMESIEEYLGMTSEEFAAFTRDPDSLACIIAARKGTGAEQVS